MPPLRSVARLDVEVRSDTRQAEQGLTRLNQRVEGVAKSFSGFRGVAIVSGLAAATGGMFKAVKMASSLEEQVNKMRVTFGAAAAGVSKSADEMAKKFGISRTTFIEAASGLGIIGQAAGLTQVESAKLGDEFGRLAADASSFYDVPLEEALTAIRAGLVGESEPIRRFGVLLNEAAVEAEALRLGLIREGEAMTEAAKVRARASLITEGLSKAQGDLNRTQDSFANLLRRVTGEATNAATSLGTKLLPHASALLQRGLELGPALAGLVQKGGALRPIFDSLGETIRNVAEMTGNLYDAAEPLLKLLATGIGAALIGSLTLLSEALVTVTRFAKDNEAIIGVLATLLAVRLTAAATAAAVSLGQTLALKALYLLDTLKALPATIGLAIKSLSALQVIAGGIAAGYIYAQQKLEDWRKEGEKFGREFSKNFDLDSYRGLNQALNATDQAIEKLNKQMGQHNWLEKLHDALPFTADDTGILAAKITELEERSDTANQRLHNFDTTVNSLAGTMGRTREGVIATANALGIDLYGNTEKASEALRTHYLRIQEGNPAVLNLKDATKKLADGTADAKEKLDAFKASLDAVIGVQISTERAQIAAAESIAKVAESTVKSKSMLDLYTESGRENRGMVLDAVEAGTALAESLANQGASAVEIRQAMDDHVARLRKTMEQAGYSREAIDRYIGMIQKIPTIADTTLSVDSKAAQTKLQAMESDVRSLGRTIESVGGTFKITTTGGPPPVPVPRVGRYALGAFKPEDHVAQIAKPGEMRLWAEPETGGEAYIPLSEAKRQRSMKILEQVAQHFGYTLAEYAQGGITRFDAHLGLVPKVDYTTTKMPPMGSGWQAIQAVMARSGIPFQTTSTVRPGAITASGNLSLHAIGKAIDMIGPNMMAIFNYLLRFQSRLRELFFTPAGFSIKDGQRVPPIAAAGHYDHVHAATYDRGGYLEPGWNVAYNGTGRRERVLGPTETGGVTVNLGVQEKADPVLLASEIAWRLR